MEIQWDVHVWLELFYQCVSETEKNRVTCLEIYLEFGQNIGID